MTSVGIRGYTSAPSVAPGESITFHVSCDEPGPYEARLLRIFHGDPNPAGPGVKKQELDAPVNGTYEGRWQRTQLGGYVEVPDDDGSLSGEQGLGIHLFLYPTIPQGGMQAVISRWSVRERAGWALTIEDGRLVFTVGDGAGGIGQVVLERQLFAEVWYSVAAGYDAASGQLTLSQRSIVNSTNSRFGPVVPLASDDAAEATSQVAPARVAVPLLIGGLAEAAGEARTWVVDHYNGKLDAPKLFGAPLGAEAEQLHRGGSASSAPLAHWNFAEGISPTGIRSDPVHDISGNERHGLCVNQPDRGMTGWNWDGSVEHFAWAPEQYGAIAFHADSLDDSRWPADGEIAVPDDLPSGCYALRVRQGEREDEIPFFVRPPRGRATAPAVVVIPTFSYLGYANSQILQSAHVGQAIKGSFAVLDALDLELHEDRSYGLSTYDYHVDGRGCQHSTWRRPILDMRSWHRHELGAVFEYAADLQLIDWLTEQGFDYDVVTDHDLAEEGVELLRRYRVALTGSHPEYWSRELIDAWETYVATGGRGMYMAGNGAYWVTCQDPDKPWLIEVRRGESGDQAWRARPGELHNSATGERGGLWRHRGRAPQKLFGTGYTSHVLDRSAPFVQLPDARDERVAWIFEGVSPDELIGDFGLVGEGAAGTEIDHYDLALGTPPHTLLLASSRGLGANARLIPEEQFFPYSGMNGEQHPGVRADMTYFTTAAGGAMFSTSSIAWCGSLSHNGYDNNVSRTTGNVLRRFLQEEPLDEVL